MLKLLIFVFFVGFSSNSSSSICQRVFLKFKDPHFMKNEKTLIRKVETLLGRSLSTKQKELMQYDARYPNTSPKIMFWFDISIYTGIAKLKHAGFSVYEIEQLIRFFEPEDHRNVEDFYFAVYKARLMKEAIGQQSMMSSQQMETMFKLVDTTEKAPELLTNELEDILRYIESVVINSPDQAVRSIVSETGLPLDFLKELIDKIFTKQLFSPDDVERLLAYAEKRDNAKKQLKAFTSKTSEHLSDVQKRLAEGDLIWFEHWRTGNFITLEDMAVLLHHDMLSEDPLVKSAIERYIEEFKEGINEVRFFIIPQKPKTNITLQKVEDVLKRPLSPRQKNTITNTLKYTDRFDEYLFPSFAAAGFSMYEIEILIRYFHEDKKNTVLDDFYTFMHRARLMKEAIGQQSMMSSQQMETMFKLEIEMIAFNNTELNNKESQVYDVSMEDILGHIEQVVTNSPDQNVKESVSLSDTGLPLNALKSLVREVFNTVLGSDKTVLLYAYAEKRDNVKKQLKSFTSKASEVLSEVRKDLERGGQFKFNILYTLGGVTFEDMKVLLHHDMLSEDPLVKSAIERYIEEEELKTKMRGNK